MTSIKEILDALPDNDRRLLSYAFEHEISQHVYINDRYIGVNLDSNKSLPQPDLKAGVWSSGICPKK
jgi:hypothetical protein